MLFSWSAECGVDDPVLVVPWSDPAGTAHFVDLREDPYAIEEISEAEAAPALTQALRALNAARSPVFTAKCDVWAIEDVGEVRALALELMLDETATERQAGFSSYLDLLWRERTTFASFHQHQHVMHRLERRMAAIEEPHALAECVIRPALVDFGAAQEGFAASLYVKAIGGSASDAQAVWATALAAVVGVLRSRDLMPHTGPVAAS